MDQVPLSQSISSVLSKSKALIKSKKQSEKLLYSSNTIGLWWGIQSATLSTENINELKTLLRFPMELHMVHMSDNGKIAVVAILYQIGRYDPFVVQIERKLKELAKEAFKGDQEVHIPVGVVHTSSLKRQSSKYYRYFGSLTTPPCTENVIWSILGKVREISREQLAALQAPLSQEYRNNSRPTQPLNYRAVQLYHESRKHDESSR